MSTGALLFPVGHIFLDDSGVPVNAGKLYAYRTGTTTAQDTFSDSTLSTPNANPVVLNSSGRATTAIYGDPSSGYDYRLRLSTSADAQIWQYDDIVVDGADTATYSEGSFTGTLTGMSSTTTGTISYRIVLNSAGTGKLCTLYISTALTGTSNSTSMTMTGVPSACQPAGNRTIPCIVQDNSNNTHAYAALTAASGTVGFATDDPIVSTGFTNTGTKGLSTGWSITYAL